MYLLRSSNMTPFCFEHSSFPHSGDITLACLPGEYSKMTNDDLHRIDWNARFLPLQGKYLFNIELANLSNILSL